MVAISRYGPYGADYLDFASANRTGPRLCDSDSKLDYVGHECLSNDECAAGEACPCGAGYRHAQYFDILLGGWGSRCVTSHCESPADCAGRACGYSRRSRKFACGGSPDGFYCRTDADECNDDDDCASFDELCSYDAARRRWACNREESCDGGREGGGVRRGGAPRLSSRARTPRVGQSRRTTGAGRQRSLRRAPNVRCRP